MKKYMKAICCVLVLVLAFGVVGSGLSSKDSMVTVANAFVSSATAGPMTTDDPSATPSTTPTPSGINSSVDTLSGDNQVVRAGDPLTARFDKDFSLFANAYVDGQELGENDLVAKSGSTIITVQGSYTAKLSQGVHALTATFRDGTTGAVYFTVSDVASPKTGDTGVVIYSAMAGLCVVAAAVWFTRRKATN